MSEEPIKRRGRPPKLKTSELVEQKNAYEEKQRILKETRAMQRAEVKKVRDENIKKKKDLRKLQVEDGENAKYLEMTMKLATMPKVNLNDYDDVAKRISDYYAILQEYDMKPTITSLALSMRCDKNTLYHIYNCGKRSSSATAKPLPMEVVELIRTAYDINENLWEHYMYNNKIGAVQGIFIGKNHFGYRDVSEHVVVQDDVQNGLSLEDIRAKYGLPQEATEQAFVEAEYSAVDDSDYSDY